MSASVWLELSFQDKVAFADLLKLLQLSGWSASSGGMTTILPLGDEDFSWTSTHYSEAALFELVEAKSAAKEIPGIQLNFELDDCVIEMIQRAETDLAFSLGFPRKAIGQTRVIDVSWYLVKLVVPIADSFVIQKTVFTYER